MDKITDGLKEKAQKIRLLALDVDGVLTDGTINIGSQGELFKGFNAKDGLGISAALKHGLLVVIVTGRVSRIVHNRAEELKITEVLEGVKDKGAAVENLARKYNLQLEEMAFMGDDLNDLPALTRVGLAAAPADAVADVRQVCSYIAEHEGGRGAVRDLIVTLLQARGLWQQIVKEYIAAGRGDRQ